MVYRTPLSHTYHHSCHTLSHTSPPPPFHSSIPFLGQGQEGFLSYTDAQRQGLGLGLGEGDYLTGHNEYYEEGWASAQGQGPGQGPVSNNVTVAFRDGAQVELLCCYILHIVKSRYSPLAYSMTPRRGIPNVESFGENSSPTLISSSIVLYEYIKHHHD